MFKNTVVNCPTCGKSLVWSKENPFRPFCSRNCKLIDLGEWILSKNIFCTKNFVIRKDFSSITIF